MDNQATYKNTATVDNFSLQPDSIASPSFPAEESPEETDQGSQSKLSFEFSGDALKKLVELSHRLRKTPVQLLLTGMKLIDISEDGKVVLEKKGGKSYVIDLEKL